MIKRQLLIIASASLLLSGCFEVRKNTDELCKSNPPLRCEKLNMRDGQCRIPRTDLIWHRFETLRNNSVDEQIQEYAILHKYQLCLDLAAQIQPIDQTDLKERRFNALMHTYDEQKRILTELAASSDPKALYFRWTHGDDDAKRAFLQLEGSGKLQTSEMQYALATYYVNRDRLKTVSLLENALRLTEKDQVNPEVIKSLASTSQALGRKEHAYIWAMVGKEFGLPVTSERNMQRLYAFSQEKKEKLEQIADNIASAAEDGNYNPKMLPDFDVTE